MIQPPLPPRAPSHLHLPPQIKPHSIFHARQLVTGDPGTEVVLIYKHRSKTGTQIYTATLVRAHIGDADLEMLPPTQGAYVGLGLRGGRFGGVEAMEEGAEAAVVEAAER